MPTVRSAAATLLSLWFVADRVAAQIATLMLPATDVRSVVVIGGGRAVVCSHQDGVQYHVDLTNPAAPSLLATFNPPFGDQWYDGEFTPDFGGRLFTGHRFGGLVMLDVGNPLTPVVAATDPSIYHYRGLRYRTFGGQSLLYYAEHNWGLAVYAVGATSLTRLWTDFHNGWNDANGMEVVGSHLYLFGSPFYLPGTRELKTYDLANPTAPALVDTLATFAAAGPAYGHCQLRAAGLGMHLLAARQVDGLDLIDLTNPAAPLATQIVPPISGLSVWGTFSYPNDTVSIAYGVVYGPGIRIPLWSIFHLIPGYGLLAIGGGVAPVEIRDIAFDPTNGRTLVAGIDLALGQGALLVY